MIYMYPITMKSGATYRLVITVNSTNLTGYSARCVFKRSYKNDEIELSVTSYLSITNAASGQITMLIPDTITATLSGVYVYDVFIESAGGESTCIMEGTVTVNPYVTPL